MSTNRRETLLAIAMAGTPLWAQATTSPKKIVRIHAKPRRRTFVHNGLYDSRSAPDSASRAILGRELSRIEQGCPKGANPGPYIQKNFQQLMEQNFARLSGRRMSALVQSMTPLELAMLAHRYQASVQASSRSAQLLDICVHRLDVAGLAKLSDCFGFGPIYEAVLRAAPEKSQDFLMSAQRTVSVLPAPASRGASGTGGDPMLDYTFFEIYLSFRTAPGGALSVPASLFETSRYVSGQLSVAWGAGYLIGSFITWGLQYFAPGVWDRVVDGLGGWMHRMSRLFLETQAGYEDAWVAEAQGEILGYSDPFGVESALLDYFAEDGGDFGCCQAWADYTLSTQTQPCPRLEECDSGATGVLRQPPQAQRPT